MNHLMKSSIKTKFTKEREKLLKLKLKLIKKYLRVFIHVLKPYLDSVTIINFVCLLFQNSYWVFRDMI